MIVSKRLDQGLKTGKHEKYGQPWSNITWSWSWSKMIVKHDYQICPEFHHGCERYWDMFKYVQIWLHGLQTWSNIVKYDKMYLTTIDYYVVWTWWYSLFHKKKSEHDRTW